VSADDYSAADAGRLLGLSEKRARQLAAAGVLEICNAKPLRVTALSVIAERERRGTQPAKRQTPATAAPALDAEMLRQIIGAVVSDLMPRMLEASQRTEDALRIELAQSRADAEQMRQRLSQLEAEQPPPGATEPARKWWRR